MRYFQAMVQLNRKLGVQTYFHCIFFHFGLLKIFWKYCNNTYWYNNTINLYTCPVFEHESLVSDTGVSAEGKCDTGLTENWNKKIVLELTCSDMNAMCHWTLHSIDKYHERYKGLICLAHTRFVID